MVFLFWAIAAGLGAGAGSFSIAIGGTIFISILFLFLNKLKFLFPTNDNYILIINYKDDKKTKSLTDLFDKYFKKISVKSSNIDKNGSIEVIYNVAFAKNVSPERFVESVKESGVIVDASLLAPNTNLYV